MQGTPDRPRASKPIDSEESDDVNQQSRSKLSAYDRRQGYQKQSAPKTSVYNYSEKQKNRSYGTLNKGVSFATSSNTNSTAVSSSMYYEPSSDQK